MQVITYLGFTLISILVQFSVMDFILVQPKADEKSLVSNVTSNRKLFRDVLHEYSNKPHALYYRTGLSHLKEYKNITPTSKNYSNITVTENILGTTIDTLSTTFEEVYDESASMMDIETTTDSFYTSTESDNVTEFILFEKKDKTVNKSYIIPKRSFIEETCDCNFLYKICDITCCCDRDCSETEISLFETCEDGGLDGKQNDVCYPQFSVKTQTSNAFGNLFCIAKTNLPEKRNKNKYDRESAIRTMEMTLKWQKRKLRKNDIGFMKKPYRYGDPIWLLKNGSINYLAVSAPVVNNYCTDRNMVQFLKDERIQCSVQLPHLEMIQILKTAEESTVISVTDRTLNASIMNCSNVHCTNWTVIICDDASCTPYNKSIHEPFCTDSKCTHIALKIDYIFYYHDLKIVNATVKLFTQNISMILPQMIQQISVQFYLANISIEQAVEFSGAPGYISGLPVIVSYVDSNHTQHFFNSRSQNNHFLLPINKNGKCIKSNTAKNVLLFGPNKRTKCRFSLEPRFLSYNSTHACKMIHNSIQEYLNMNYMKFVSPNGNPYGQKDEQWLSLQAQVIEKETLHGEFLDEKSSLMCRNIVTDVFFMFTYADRSMTNDKVDNKILTAAVQMTERNVTLNVEDFTIVLTVDITFIDVTKPPVYEFAGSPDLKINLPADFFFPFPNSAFVNKCNFFQFVFICGIVFMFIKIK